MGERWTGLDDAVEQAWQSFRVAVGDRLAALTEGEAWRVDLVGTDPGEVLEAAPVVEVRRTGPDALRVEIAGGGSQEVAQRDVDRVAARVVQALREVHGCLHPAFLTGHGLAAWGPAPVPAAPASDGEQPATVFPRCRDDLVAALDAAVGEIVGHPPVKDDDGAIAVGEGPSVVVLSVLADRPVIELLAEVVLEVTDLSAMPREIELLNRRAGPGRFHSLGTTVMMRQELLAWPFTRTQLGVLLADMLETVAEVADELVLRIGGRTVDEVGPEEAGPEEAPATELLPPEHLPLRMLLGDAARRCRCPCAARRRSSTATGWRSSRRSSRCGRGCTTSTATTRSACSTCSDARCGSSSTVGPRSRRHRVPRAGSASSPRSWTTRRWARTRSTWTGRPDTPRGFSATKPSLG